MPLLWEMRKTKPERARQVQAACELQCPSRTGVRGARGLRHKQGRVRTQALSLWVGVSSSLPPPPMTADTPEKSRPPVPSPQASVVYLHASGRRPGRGRRDGAAGPPGTPTPTSTTEQRDLHVPRLQVTREARSHPPRGPAELSNSSPVESSLLGDSLPAEIQALGTR